MSILSILNKLSPQSKEPCLSEIKNIHRMNIKEFMLRNSKRWRTVCDDYIHERYWQLHIEPIEDQWIQTVSKAYSKGTDEEFKQALHDMELWEINQSQKYREIIRTT